MTKITADMLVGDVLDAHPELAKFFLEIPAKQTVSRIWIMRLNIM